MASLQGSKVNMFAGMYILPKLSGVQKEHGTVKVPLDKFQCFTFIILYPNLVYLLYYLTSKNSDILKAI